jgi:phage FluMu protein Com
MDLRCPKCNSTDLKKVSLAYQEGLFRTDARTRLSAALVGGNGPDLVVGRATTQASHQSALSKQLSPPAKWSYLKVGSWFVLAFLCLGWLIFYVNTVTTNATTVLTTPVAVFGLIGAGIFVFLIYFVWKHNHSTYPQQYTEWDRSFLCQRCGTVSEQKIDREHESQFIASKKM